MLSLRLATIVSLMGVAIASPIAGSEQQLSKRGNGIHLVDCNGVYKAVIVCSTISIYTLTCQVLTMLLIVLPR
jgi:hypothetical protein